MDEQIRLAFTFASDLSKQLITLSTGILALTVTFTKDVVQRIPAKGAWALATAWIFYFISIICGIWSLMALTGTLAPMEKAIGSLTLAENIRIPSAFQIITFLLATILIIIYGSIALIRYRSESFELKSPDSNHIKNLESRNDLDEKLDQSLNQKKALSDEKNDKSISEVLD